MEWDHGYGTEWCIYNGWAGWTGHKDALSLHTGWRCYAAQLSSALAFGARDLGFRLPGVWVAWKGTGWIAHTSHHIHSLAFLDAGG